MAACSRGVSRVGAGGRRGSQPSEPDHRGREEEAGGQVQGGEHRTPGKPVGTGKPLLRNRGD